MLVLAYIKKIKRKQQNEKNIIALSVVAALSTTTFAADANKEMLNQIQALKAQIDALEKKKLLIKK